MLVSSKTISICRSLTLRIRTLPLPFPRPFRTKHTLPHLPAASLTRGPESVIVAARKNTFGLSIPAIDACFVRTLVVACISSCASLLGGGWYRAHTLHRVAVVHGFEFRLSDGDGCEGPENLGQRRMATATSAGLWS
jgi:hypothetical protein